MLSTSFLTVGTVLTGLMAGLFFAFACAVTLALKTVDDRTYVDVMQRINRAIQNGAFGLCLFGAALLPAVGAGLAVGAGRLPVALWAAAGWVCYLLVLVVTFGVNIPLNNRLAGAGSARLPADPGLPRRLFERRWNRSNGIRTLLCLAALALQCQALVLAP